MLLNLLKDGEVHTLKEAIQIDPRCPLLSWQTIAIDMRNRGVDRLYPSQRVLENPASRA
jgi:hypothetical protein